MSPLILTLISVAMLVIAIQIKNGSGFHPLNKYMHHQNIPFERHAEYANKIANWLLLIGFIILLSSMLAFFVKAIAVFIVPIIIIGIVWLIIKSRSK